MKVEHLFLLLWSLISCFSVIAIKKDYNNYKVKETKYINRHTAAFCKLFEVELIRIRTLRQ